jgi:hypothetical protein
MKKVYVIGFLGLGIRDPRYQTEPGLIKVGHVGIAFEGHEEQILGFHPSPEAIEAVGGPDKALAWLRNRKAGNRLDGCLQDDTRIFERAYQLSQDNSQCMVWQTAVEFDEARFERLREQAQQWYNAKTIFPYAFPLATREVAWDNCATFPRHLGISLPESSGQLQKYIPTLQDGGMRWKPKGVHE